ncbi:MAG: hypothetical protein WC822_01275 [Candidatus Paceibacterota bacterium]
MALTLLDMQRQKKDPYDQGVIETFMAEAELSKIIPMETTGTMEVTARRRSSIPDIGSRSRGQAYPSIQGGTFDTITDQVFAIGTTIDIDKVDMRDKNLLEDPMSERTKESVTAMAWKYNDLVINGDHGVNPDLPEGIKVRLASLPAAQTVYANSSSASLDVRPSGSPTNATLHTWLDKIDEAIYQLDGHTADICLTNADWIRTYKSALRRLGISKLNEPVTGQPTNPSNTRRTGSNFQNKPIFEYNGVKFYDMGLKIDQTTPVVGTETIGDTTRPAYFLKIGKPYFHGIQEYGMEISKPTMTDDHVTWRTVVDWPMGFRHIHPRFMAALRGSRVA